MQALNALFAAARQRLVVTHESGEFVLLQNERTLASYHLQSDATVDCVMSSDFCGGEHVRTIDAESAGIKLRCPCGVCVSPDGLQLFVADSDTHSIRVFSATDGQLLRTIGSAGMFSTPKGVCLSPDGELLYGANSLRASCLIAGLLTLTCVSQSPRSKTTACKFCALPTARTCASLAPGATPKAKCGIHRTYARRLTDG